MTKKYDIMIVGGGVAGLTCAWRLSQKTDASIALLERKESIGRNVTPGTLNIGFVDRLKRWGFSKAIERTYTRLGLYTADESAKFDLGGKPVGASINYGKFCRLLARRSSGNADIFTGIKAGKIEWTGHGIRINGEFDARLMIDASGAGMLVRKKLKLRLPRRYSAVRGARFSGCSLGDRDEMSLILDSPYCTGGGWLYPLGRNGGASCGVAFLENSAAAAGMKKAQDGFGGMVASFEPFSEYLKDAEIEEMEWGVVPIEPAKKLAHDRMLVVGDAAGQAFPLLVEGFRPAVESAVMCSDVAAEAYSCGDFGQRMLGKYEREWNRTNGRRYLMERVSSDVAFGRSPEGWSGFMRKIRGLDPEIVIPFVGGDLKDKTAIRKMLPKREALKALLGYLRYGFFDWL